MLVSLWGRFRLEKGIRAAEDLDERLVVGSGLKLSTSLL